MDKEELKKDIREYLGSVIIPDIPCCEDSITNYDAYNNLDSMYNHNNVESANIRIFLDYDIDIDDLANKLGVDSNKLNDMFRFSMIPSKGLTSAICLILNLSLDDTILILNKMSYKLGNDDFDKIIRYFFIKDIRDIELLNEILVSFGCMYLYSKKKLR